jgi:ubiquitin carboxyl-terminal hydrolase 10
MPPGTQSPYPHPGPSYYPPPPTHMHRYGYTNVPSYAYPYPPQPMNGHSPAPPSPRVSGRGGFHGVSRGGHGSNYNQNYSHHPHPHPHAPPPSHSSYIPHVPMHPSPQPSTPNSYPQHQKYTQQHTTQIPYSPPYPPPSSQPSAPYQQNWVFQQPISPLPKQLSMPPPPALSPVAPSPKPPRILDGPLDPELTYESTESSDSPQKSSPKPALKEPTRTPLPHLRRPALPLTNHFPVPAKLRDHCHSYLRSLYRPPSPAPTSSSIKKQNVSMDPKEQFGGWAIWSRRPTNPSLAPGIIISPRSRPPQDVLEKALRVSTPPESPKPAVVDLPATPPCVIAVIPPDLLPTQATPDEPQKLASDPAESPRNDLPETVSSTETEVSTVSDTPPVPTSPLSSSTSVSAADTAHSQAKSLSESCERAAGIVASIVTQESTPAEVPEPPPALPSSSLNTTVPTAPEAVSSSVAPAFSPAPASTSTPTPASARRFLRSHGHLCFALPRARLAPPPSPHFLPLPSLASPSQPLPHPRLSLLCVVRSSLPSSAVLRRPAQLASLCRACAPVGS